MLTLKVAVTGGLSSGKSSVCRIFKQLGAYVVSADELVHQLLSPKTNLGQKIINLLGTECVVNGQFDRAKIAHKVFNNPSLLKSYENLLHPEVREEIEKHFKKAKAKKFPLYIAEIPLLFETDAHQLFPITIAVEADPELCRERFKATRGYDQHEYERRMMRQLKNKHEKATYVITNNGSLHDLEQSVETLYKKLVETD